MMNLEDYFLMMLPVPVYYLYKGRDGSEKVTSRRKAFYPFNMIPHPVATELHGVYIRKKDIPDLDEVFSDSEPDWKQGDSKQDKQGDSKQDKQGDSKQDSQYRCPYIE